MASKVTATRGDRAPELSRVAELIEQLHDRMYAHIQKEEQVCFRSSRTWIRNRLSLIRLRSHAFVLLHIPSS